jgi:ribosomal protein S18 acetylase RimI-like enzyme
MGLRGSTLIQFANVSHISKIVDIHRSALPSDFLPKLGKKFLTEFYKGFIERNDITIIFTNGRIIGFLALSIVPISNLGIIMNNMGTILFKLLSQPSLWGQTLWFFFGNKKKIDCPEISIIAIKPSSQGNSFGSQLLNFACDHLIKQGYQCICVKTEADNLLSNRFYQKNYFRNIGCEKRFNRNFYIYFRGLNTNVA